MITFSAGFYTMSPVQIQIHIVFCLFRFCGFFFSFSPLHVCFSFSFLFFPTENLVRNSIRVFIQFAVLQYKQSGFKFTAPVSPAPRHLLCGAQNFSACLDYWFLKYIPLGEYRALYTYTNLNSFLFIVML